MATDYKVGAVADILANNSSKKSKKKKGSLFDERNGSVTPIFKPFHMKETVKEPEVDESNTSPPKAKKEKRFKNPKTDDEIEEAKQRIQRRKEKKVKKKEAKRKLHEMKQNAVEKKDDNDDEGDGNDSNNDNEDENEGESPRKKAKFTPVKAGNDAEAESRTVFVGNLPITIKKMDLKKYFSKVGPVESVRLRCAAIAKPDVSKRVSVLRQEFHPERTSISGFVVYVKLQDANKALALNGKVYEGHHIRVDLSSSDRKPDHKRSIFVGNLPFNVEEEDLWSTFDDCGDINSVRVVRDRNTGVGRGFGYVTFKDQDSLELALKMSGHEMKGRKMRVSRSKDGYSKKDKEDKKNKFALSKQSLKKNKGKSFGGKVANSKDFQGVVSKKGLKLKLAKKNKNDKIKPSKMKKKKSKPKSDE